MQYFIQFISINQRCRLTQGQNETQSTHKLLAAFSQSSMLHIKGDHNEEVLNEAFMLHTSTSPFYPIVASVETAAMMGGLARP